MCRHVTNCGAARTGLSSSHRLTGPNCSLTQTSSNVSCTFAGPSFQVVMWTLLCVGACVWVCFVIPRQTNLSTSVWAITALTEVWPAACPVSCSIISLLKWKQMEAISVVQRGPQWIGQWSQVDRHRYTWRCGLKLKGTLASYIHHCIGS